jgi:hypothetical protein
MFQRDSLKVLEEALFVLEQGFSAMPEFKPALLSAEGREVLRPAKPGSGLH